MEAWRSNLNEESAKELERANGQVTRLRSRMKKLAAAKEE